VVALSLATNEGRGHAAKCSGEALAAGDPEISEWGHPPGLTPGTAITCGGLALVREDRAGRTAGEPVVGQPAPLGSYVRRGEPLKASKRESLPKTSLPRSRDREPPGRPPGYEAAGGRRVSDRSQAVLTPHL